ncbi:MAG: glycosyltransferase family 1 protein [Elainellaceae cyanobacterium]
MDFLVETNDTSPCSFEDEIRARGSRIFTYPHTLNFGRYDRQIKQVLRDYGPYDIVHSHDNSIGRVIRSAYEAGVPVRIAHSHTDLFAVQTLFKTQASLQRRLAFQLLLSLKRRWVHRYATLGFGCSQVAAASLFGTSWKTDPRWHVLYCGIDLTPFEAHPDPIQVRAELGIPDDRFVIGHVGRFSKEKNHKFLLNIFAEVVQRHPKTHLLLIGEGLLKPVIEQQVAQMGLNHHVTFAGLRSDVPRLMKGAMDVFLFPSLFEGLGLVLIEAQAAGLPCLFSDLIPADADVVPPLIHRVSLSKSPSEWADVLLQLQNAVPAVSPAEALARVSNSSHNFEQTLQQLELFYRTHYAQTVLKHANQPSLLLRTG